jgi:octaprenyl-diphosphate synthase
MSNLKQLEALSEIKSLAQDDLNKMDLAIKARLSSKEQLVQDITYHIISSGGKRLRPALLILIAKLFGYNGQRHINLAAAVEFIHTATLLHDDVVDHSSLRRGKLTANQNWDNKSSILVGDFLFSQSFLLMSEDSDVKVLEILSKAAAIIAEGEVKQLSSIANLDLILDDYLRVISAKTAELFAAACQVGAVIADADNHLQESMYHFGLNLGMAFQIIDDVMDYMADKASMGKNIGDDFKEAKVTLPIILAFENSNLDEKEFWNKAINQKNQQEKDFEIALDIFSKYEVIDKCFDMAKEYALKAQVHIEQTPDHEIKNILIKMLSFSVNRDF